MVIVKVGLSRKLSKDFNSQGYTLDIQSEMPSQLIEDPQAMATATDHLFQLANDLLDEQVKQRTENGNGSAGSRLSAAVNRNTTTNGNTYHQHRPANGNGNATAGHGNGHKETRNGRSITSAQINAIQKMAEKFDTNGDAIAGDDYGCKLAQLNIRQASELIDRLKKGLEAQGQRETGR